MSQLDEAEGSNVANPLKPLFKKKRSGKGKSSNTLRSFLGDTNDKEASSIEAGGEGGEQGEEERYAMLFGRACVGGLAFLTIPFESF